MKTKEIAAPRGEQEWTVEDHRDESGGMFLCFGTKKIWFMSKDFVALDSTAKEINAALSAEREAKMTWAKSCQELRQQLKQQLAAERKDALDWFTGYKAENERSERLTRELAEREKREKAEEQLRIRSTEYVPTTKYLELREQLLSAQAAIAALRSASFSEVSTNLAKMIVEYVNGGIKAGTDWTNGLSDIIAKRLKRLQTKDDITVDLSALGKHDEEVRDEYDRLRKDYIATQIEQARKPLVDALKNLVRDCKAQDINLGASIGDAEAAIINARTDLGSDFGRRLQQAASELPEPQ